MRLEWDDSSALIGRYECTLYDDNNEELQKISIKDFTNKVVYESDVRNQWHRHSAYEIYWCNGWSMREYFGHDEIAYREDHFLNRYGYNGHSNVTLEDVKKYCEEWLVHFYIMDYEKALQELQAKKEISDRLKAMGYTGNYQQYIDKDRNPEITLEENFDEDKER